MQKRGGRSPAAQEAAKGIRDRAILHKTTRSDLVQVTRTERKEFKE